MTAVVQTTQTGTAAVEEADASTVWQWLQAGQACLVDVREPDEHARERIPGARLVPLSCFDPARVWTAQARVVLHCERGRRSLEAARRMADAGYRNIVSLRGGLQAWRAAGLPVVRDRAAPLPIMRQVQIVIGTGVLAGSVLAYLVSPWFLLLTGFFGAGLLFAGLTGRCGLAAALARLPWNRLPAMACTAQPGSGVCGPSS